MNLQRIYGMKGDGDDVCEGGVAGGAGGVPVALMVVVVVMVTV